MRNMLVLALAFALAACSPPAEKAAPAPATTTQVEPGAAGSLVEFMAPSGNIGCTYVPAGGTPVYRSPDGGAELKCDRVEPTYVRFTLSEHGPAARMDNVGEASCCSGETLDYGQNWGDGPFSCTMAEESLTCTNADGRGFLLSRDKAETR